MANAYRKVYLQVIFAVKFRQALLHHSWRPYLFQYISGVLNKRGHYSLAVNGYYDHTHLFFDYGCHELISDLVREVKKASVSFIRTHGFCRYKFQWQPGYAVFSYSHWQKETIIEYVKNQEQHHSNNSFKKEYLKLLKDFEIEFEDEYVFEFFD